MSKVGVCMYEYNVLCLGYAKLELLDGSCWRIGTRSSSENLLMMTLSLIDRLIHRQLPSVRLQASVVLDTRYYVHS